VASTTVPSASVAERVTEPADPNSSARSSHEARIGLVDAGRLEAQVVEPGGHVGEAAAGPVLEDAAADGRDGVVTELGERVGEVAGHVLLGGDELVALEVGTDHVRRCRQCRTAQSPGSSTEAGW
jgi:hypothetical protein